MARLPKTGSFSIWLRGREVIIVGCIEPADRDVGIMTDYFDPYDIIDLRTGYFWSVKETETLSDSEINEINLAFFEHRDMLISGDFYYDCYLWREAWLFDAMP